MGENEHRAVRLVLRRRGPFRGEGRTNPGEAERGLWTKEERGVPGMVSIRQALQAFWSYSGRQEMSEHRTKKMVSMGMVWEPAGSPGGASGTWKWIQGWPRQTRPMITKPARLSARLSRRLTFLASCSSRQPLGSWEWLSLHVSRNLQQIAHHQCQHRVQPASPGPTVRVPPSLTFRLYLPYVHSPFPVSARSYL